MLDSAIKTIRQYHGLSQKELASRLSISNSYLSELESGRKKPSLEVLHKYSDLFNVPLSSLLVFSETLSGDVEVDSVRSFIAKKMLTILEWVADKADIDDEIDRGKVVQS